MTISANVLTETTHVTPIREAYLKLRDEISAVSENDLVAINVDIQTVVTATRGRLPQILTFRERLAQELPTVAVSAFDKLEDYLFATAYTHGQYRMSSAPAQNLQDLQADAAEFRETLFSDASALHKRGIIDGSKLAELKGANGYRGTAFDLLTLYTLLRENWDKIQGKTALSLEELERAGVVADELMNGAGMRETAPQKMATVILNRQRAFTLFAQAYDQVRRCIQFLRWNEGDADEIAPSLYAGRRRKTGSDLTPDEDVNAAPASPTPATVTAPGASAVVAAPLPASTATAKRVAIGLPGSDPFVG